MAKGLKKIKLKKNEEFRLYNGDLWVFDNEILTDLSSLEKGELVHIYSYHDKYVATAYANPFSKITLRILTRAIEEKIDKNFFKKRIQEADDIRRTINSANRYYRMVYAEADFLPGLVIDRFDDYFIVQITTAGMENFKEDIFSIVYELYPSAVIIEKSISSSRLKENLDEINRILDKRNEPVKIIGINGIKFKADFLISQKTGFFLDQRDNYLLLKDISENRNVLDVFSYAGAWGLHAYKFGARSVVFLEISSDYLNQAKVNAELNDFDLNCFTFIRDDAIKILKKMSKEGIKKDVIVLDPPAFVKSRKKLKDALRGYKEINLRALKMLNPKSFLISCSCSHFLNKEEFIKMIYAASQDANRRIKILDFKQQPYDHAVLFPLIQSEYLKCGLFYVY